MALNLFNRYGSRSTPPDTNYPNGSFKNRSAPNAKDGTYLEKDWANDIWGFLSAILSKSGVTPSGNVETALSSQYADALFGRFGTAGGLSFRNKLINAAGTINQRVYASGQATTAANQYTIDRWKVLVSGQNLSWAVNGAVMIMTAPAGGAAQVIDGSSIEGGTYVLNWLGSATATVNGVAIFKGVPFVLPANTNVVLVFSSGTFSCAQLECGNVPTGFELRPKSFELVLCQNYFLKSYPYLVKPGSVGAGAAAPLAVSFSTQVGSVCISVLFAGYMRQPPAVTLYNPSTGAIGTFLSANSESASLVDVATTSGFNINNTAEAGSLNDAHRIHWTADAEI